MSLRRRALLPVKAVAGKPRHPYPYRLLALIHCSESTGRGHLSISLMCTQIPRLGGCWRGTIRAQDMTEQTVIGPFQLGAWADEDYRICFGYDLHPQVSVAVTELEMRSS